MEQNIVDIETLKRAIIERNEQNHIELITNSIAVVSDISMAKYSNIVEIDMWACVLCVSGSCRLTLNYGDYEIQHGTLLVYQPNQRFKIEQLSDDCSGKILFVANDVVDESLSKITDLFNFMLYVQENPCVQLTEKQCEMLLRYEQLIILKTGETGNLFHKEVANNLLMAMFFELFNIYSQNLLQKDNFKTKSDRVFERFLQCVSKNYKSERSIKFYAQEIGITPKYLSQLCFQVSGRHAGDWIDRFVIAKAKSLLLDSDLTIQQISNSLNFANQSFFGKYFRKQVGQSPGQFRKNGGK
ncbi:MAG: AraC family transcriptional regulator [Bacteroidales bacterium]|nr:AraC family transcriptional regulator [Bacteroidales bacterium]